MLTSMRIVIRAGQQWSANGDSRLGAALAYYTLFSIAPLLVIAMTITGIVFGPSAAQGEVKSNLSKYIDEESAVALQNLVHSASAAPGTIWSQLLSLGLLVFGALGAFLHLRYALCLIWKLEPLHLNTFLATLLDYLLAFILVLFTGVLLIASVAAGIAVSYIRAYIDPDGALPWSWLEFAVSISFLGLLFAAIYHILSGRRIAWHHVGFGAAIAALLFTLGKIVLSYYFVYAGVASAYGAAGSLVVFLVWVYYSSQTLFFGAELIQARRTRQEWLNAPAPPPRP
jgi:membrane protein